MHDDILGTAPADLDDGPIDQHADLLDRSGNPDLRGEVPLTDPQHLERFESAVGRGDYRGAVLVVRDGWFDFLVSDQQRLRRAVDRLPHSVVHDSPLLAMLAALVYNSMTHRRAKALRLLLSAARAASSDRNDLEPIDRALVLTAASVSFRLIGLSKQGMSAARLALRVLDGVSDEQRQNIPALSRLYAQVGTSLYYGGRLGDALDALEHGLAEIPVTGYRHGFSNLGMLAGIQPSAASSHRRRPISSSPARTAGRRSPARPTRHLLPRR